MVMPAFNMEPDSTPPPSGDAAATKPARPETAAAKPPPASLISIATKGKPSVATKAGDLTRLFELARRQAAAPAEPAPIEALPAEPPPMAAAPAELEIAPDPMPVAPAPIEASAADISPEPTEPLHLEAAPEPASVEPAALAAAPVASDAAFELPEPSFETVLPLMLAPRVTAEDVIEAPTWVEPPSAGERAPAPETPGPLAFEMVPAENTPAPLEMARPTLPLIEPPAAPAPAATIEAETPIEPQPPRLVTPPAPVAVAPLPTPVPAPAPAPAPAPVALEFADLADYWRSLRVGDDHPAAESIDRDLVIERWPGSLLIGYTPASQDPRGELRPARVTRLGTACAETQSAVDAGSHATEWMLEVARAALLNDEPLEELQRLATRTGAAGFRLVALPLGPANGLANAVLCALVPNSAAPRFGKRRAWL